jgi:kinesin family protein C2/C3
MEGYGPNKGVAPRAVDELFKNVMAAGESGNYEYTVVFSMLEIYNETIRDLLDSGGAAGKEKDRLDVRQSAEGVNIVQGLIEETVESAARVAELMAVGQSNRAVGSHDMNEHSSRSHSILTLTCRGRNLRDNSTTFGKLHLIDLAGSERLSKTDASGDRLKEAQNINRSLSALGDVISALGNKKATHIPYRNSKVSTTCFITDSIDNGNCYL